ncbi:Uncharacterised protein [Mycobacteroides abscessus subsp. abscessus]|nr:Uncharacterised protein [Mycobacteroides abscessus subsp. bolletii]SKS27791.1 Uncharacterised protein [Mycobacteroides abscessus subsp. abscessus]
MKLLKPTLTVFGGIDSYAAARHSFRSCLVSVLVIVLSIVNRDPFNTYEGYISAAIWAFLFAAEYDPRR